MKSNLEYKEYEVINKSELAPETFLFQLDGKIQFDPGQFVQIALDHFGEGTFAPCSNPESKKYFEICVRGTGNLSNQLIKVLPGDKLKVRGPYGHGWPIAKLLGKNIIIVAGGMGMVPIRPLLFELLKYKKEFKKIYLVAGFRSPHHVLFEDELANMSKKLDFLEVMVEHTERNFWGKKGMITEPLKNLSPSTKNTVALICGPEVMCPSCNKILLNRGIKEENIFISMERRMECGIGICQHCNIGKYLVCQDGPVFSLDKIKDEIGK